MKKILLGLIGILFFIPSFAQKIHFSDKSNIWNTSHHYSLDGIHPIAEYFSYYFISDTVCHSFHYNRFNFSIFTCAGCPTLIREDTVAKKIYIRVEPEDTELVLMDYALHVGDTFKLRSDISYHYIVTDTSSTQINGITHRVWHFSRFDVYSHTFYPWSTVVEGIGCVENPTYMLKSISMADTFAYAVYCFSNNGSTPPLIPGVSYLNNTTSCSSHNVGIGSAPLWNNTIHLYPNPATSELTISSPEPINTVSITSLLGQTLYSRSFNTHEATINISDLPTGLYLVHINRTEVRKLIKE